MFFSTVGQERILWASEWSYWSSRYAVTVTTARLMMHETASFGLGGQSASGRYLPLEMIDVVSVASYRRSFPILWFLIGSLFFLVPGIVVFVFWLLYRPHAIAFGSSDGSGIRLFGMNPRGPDAQELTRVVESARQAQQSQGPASSETPDTALPSPPRVTLNP